MGSPKAAPDARRGGRFGRIAALTFGLLPSRSSHHPQRHVSAYLPDVLHCSCVLARPPKAAAAAAAAAAETSPAPRRPPPVVMTSYTMTSPMAAWLGASEQRNGQDDADARPTRAGRKWPRGQRRLTKETASDKGSVSAVWLKQLLATRRKPQQIAWLRRLLPAVPTLQRQTRPVWGNLPENGPAHVHCQSGELMAARWHEPWILGSGFAAPHGGDVIPDACLRSSAWAGLGAATTVSTAL